MSGEREMKRVHSLKRVATRIETQFSTPPKTTTFQKLFMIMGAGIFVALASLTASLPIPLPGSQSITTTSTISSGDTAWMIVATIFAILASPAAAYLFANMYNIRSATLVQTVVLVFSVVSFLWVIVTFSLIHGPETWGDKLLGFPIRYYMFAHVGAQNVSSLANTIPASIFAVFELAFAVLAPTIIAAAVAERVTVYGFLVFILVWHVCIYAPIAFITWNMDGWFYTHDVMDFSGGLVVNQLAAITVLVLEFYLNWTQAPQRTHATSSLTPAAVKKRELGMLLGALAFWFLSFGLQAGKAHAANYVAAQSVVNTIAGVMTSILANYLLDEATDEKFNAQRLSAAVVLGLIATTPCSGFVTVGGAMVVVLITILAVRLVSKVMTLCVASEPSAPPSFAMLFGVGGTVSFIFTALISYMFVNPAGYNGLTHGFAGSADSIRYHTAVVLAFWPSTAIAVLLCAFLVDLLVPLSKTEQAAGEENNYSPTNIGPMRAQSAFFSTADIYRQNSMVPSASPVRKN